MGGASNNEAPPTSDKETDRELQLSDDGVSGVGGLVKGDEVEDGLWLDLLVRGLLVREHSPLKHVTTETAEHVTWEGVRSGRVCE